MVRPLQPKLYTEAVREIMLKKRLDMIANEAASLAACFAMPGERRPRW